MHATTDDFIVERNESGQLVATRTDDGREMVLEKGKAFGVVEAWYSSADRDALAPMANTYLHTNMKLRRSRA